MGTYGSTILVNWPCSCWVLLFALYVEITLTDSRKGSGSFAFGKVYKAPIMGFGVLKLSSL